MRRICEILFICVLVVCIAGCSGLSDVKNSGGGQATGVTVSPGAASLNPFDIQGFTAKVQGTTNNAVTWQVNGVTGGSATTGIIDSAGHYTAPHAIVSSLAANDPITVTITAISQASATATGTAVVTLTTQQQQTQSGAIKLGTSGGNISDTSGDFCCGGTLGALVTRNGTQYILSNNHVLAKSAGNAGSPDVGDAITQPGLIEVNCQSSSTHTVAHLSEYFPLQTGPIPKIDAALAQVASGTVDTSGNILLLGSTLTNGVPDPGPVGVTPTSTGGLTPTQATGSPHNGAVAKSGRTTGLTCSTIVATNVASNVDYYAHCGDANAAFTVSYTDLVAVNGGDFSYSGDSGSLIVTQDTAEAVALLFAGSDTDTVGNPIADVLPAFPGAGNVTPTFIGSNTTHQVIGCTLPALKAVTKVPQVKAVAESIQQASMARDLHASQLLTIPAIKAVAVGESYDHPGKAAILLFVGSGESLADIPRTVDGVPTRLIKGNDWAHQGLLNSEESADLLSTVSRPQIVYPLQQGEYLRAKTVHTAHVTDLLKQAGILGVGITSSVDAPGEAALLIYVLRGAPQDNIPAEIDGLRTRIRETSPFTTGRRGNEPARSCKVPVAKTLLTKTSP